MSKRLKKGQRGFDGAKLIKGRKRFILVDTIDLVLTVLVTEANVPERDGAEWLLTALGDKFPRRIVLKFSHSDSYTEFAKHPGYRVSQRPRPHDAPSRRTS